MEKGKQNEQTHEQVREQNRTKGTRNLSFAMLTTYTVDNIVKHVKVTNMIIVVICHIIIVVLGCSLV